MALSEEQMRLIEGHIDGTLDAKEQEMFLDEQSKNPQFQEELQFQKALISRLKAMGKADLKAKLKNELKEVLSQGTEPDLDAEEEDQSATEAQPKSRSGWRWMGLAASVLLLATIAFFVFRENGSSNGKQAFADYFSPLPAQPYTRDDQEQVELALQPYRKGDFQAAVPLLREAASKAEADPWLELYLGNAYLASDSSEQAIQALQSAEQHGDAKLDVHANWYLALAHLQKGDLNAAKSMLGQIVQSDSPYAAKAAELLEDL